MPSQRRDEFCVVPGDPQVVDLVVSSLPTRASAGQPATEFFGQNGAGFLVPMGEYAGATWSRTGRANVTAVDTPAIPLIPGVPVVLAPHRGREVYLRQSDLVTASGTISLVFYPALSDEDLDNPYLLAAFATSMGGGGGSTPPPPAPATPFPAASALSDNDPNPTTTRVGSNLLGWDPTGSVWDRLKAQGIGGALSAHADGVLIVAGANYALSGAAWERMRLNSAVSDAISAGTIVPLDVGAVVRGVNPAGTFDRIRSDGDDTDNEAAATLGRLLTLARGTVLNDRTNAWERERQADAYSDRIADVAGAAADSTGAKLSVTCPAGATIRVRACTAFCTVGASATVVDLEYVPSGGSAIKLARYSLINGEFPPDQAPAQNLRMVAGDVVRWNVTSAGPAGAELDLTISYEQTRYPI